MTSDDSHDASAESLKRLMALAPDPDRAERVRVRCRTQLERSRRRAARTAVITGFAWHVLAPVSRRRLLCSLRRLLVATTLRLQGVFH